MSWRQLVGLGCSLAMLLVAAPARAMDERAGDALLVQEALEVLFGGRPRAGCPSGVLAQLRGVWSRLPQKDRKRLEPLMQRPGATTVAATADTGTSVPATAATTDSATAEAGPRGRPESPPLTSATAHFVLHYGTTGEDAVPAIDADGNGVPDYVQSTGEYLEKAFADIKAAGFRAPGEHAIDIYFRKIPYNGLTHYEPDGDSWKAWIEVTNDVAGQIRANFGGEPDPAKVTHDPAGLQTGQLKGLSAHELFHAVEARYNARAPRWWTEGCADWMTARVFPETGYSGQFVAAHLAEPHQSLFAHGGQLEYSASMFPTFLSESGPGPDAVRRIWELHEKAPLEQALAIELGDLRGTFMTYACHNALRAYQDTWGMPKPARERVASYPATVQPTAGLEPRSYGNWFVELLPGDGKPGTLRITVETAEPEATAVRVVAIRPDGTWAILRAPPMQENSATIAIPDFGTAIARVMVVTGYFNAERTAQLKLTATRE